MELTQLLKSTCNHSESLRANDHLGPSETLWGRCIYSLRPFGEPFSTVAMTYYCCPSGPKELMHFPYTSCFLCVYQLMYQMVSLTNQFAWHKWVGILLPDRTCLFLDYKRTRAKRQQASTQQSTPQSTLGLFMKCRVANCCNLLSATLVFSDLKKSNADWRY